MPVGTVVPAVASVLFSTLTKSRKKLIMASVKSNALQAWAFSNNRVEFEDGGYNITNPITVGRNANIASYRYMDPLPVAQTDEFENLEYGYSRVAGTVIISEQEEDENKGEAQIFKLTCTVPTIYEPISSEEVREIAWPTKAPIHLDSPAACWEAM